MGRRAARKIAQRIRRGNRPPAGGFLLAAKVVEHWREHPELLSQAELRPFIRPDWIDGMLERRFAPRPSSVAFLTSLMVATRRHVEIPERADIRPLD
jgi:asparagine synthase (glutamine-hydrolysing)